MGGGPAGRSPARKRAMGPRVRRRAKPVASSLRSSFLNTLAPIIRHVQNKATRWCRISKLTFRGGKQSHYVIENKDGDILSSKATRFFGINHLIGGGKNKAIDRVYAFCASIPAPMRCLQRSGGRTELGISSASPQARYSSRTCRGVRSIPRLTGPDGAPPGKWAKVIRRSPSPQAVVQ